MKRVTTGRGWLPMMLLAAMATGAKAQVIAPSVSASGGTLASGDGYLLAGTVGQPVIGPTAGISLIDWQGVWFVPRVATPLSVATPSGPVTGFTLHRNFPNPFSDATDLRIDLPRRTPLTVTLYDAVGKEVRTLFSGEPDAGTLLLHLSAEALASGPYIVRAMAGDEQRMLSIMVVR
jgi:hypothetical protein